MKLTNKKILFAVTALFIIALMPFIQSCSNTDESLQIESSKNTSLEYLDVDVSKMQEPTEKQMQILKKAKDRINPYVVLEGKTYVLTISKASDVQMSERLFKSIKTTISSTNSLIEKLNVVVDKNNPKLLNIVQSPNLSKNTRYKILGYESTPVDGQNSWNVDWSGAHLYLNNETAKKLTALLITGCAISEVAALIQAATGVAAPTAVVTSLAGVAMGWGAGMIGNYNEGKGVVISEGFSLSIESR